MSGEPCVVCRKRDDQPCVNTLHPGKQLPGRLWHLGRQSPSVWVKR